MAARSLNALSDHDLLSRLHHLVRDHNRVLAELLATLGEVDARKLYRQAACSSMHVYCVERLGFSDAAAYGRITAARTARRFSRVLELVSGGQLNLSGIRLLAPHLTVDNCEQLLEEACGKTCQQLAELIAAHFPKPDVPERIRKLPERATSPRGACSEGPLGGSAKEPAPRTGQPSGTLLASASADTHRGSRSSVQPRATVKPLAPSRYKVELTVSGELRDKFERARNLTSHKYPQGDLVAVLEEAIDLLIAQVEKRRFGVGTKRRPTQAKSTHPETSHAESAQPLPTQAGLAPAQQTPPAPPTQAGLAPAKSPQAQSPQAESPQAQSPQAQSPQAQSPHPQPTHAGSNRRSGTRQRSRRVPADVRRRVYARDQGRCTYTDARGRRCSAERFLEIDHVVPFGLGGAHTLDNLRLRCREHNQEAAEAAYGRQHVARAIRQAGSAA